jgi:molybdopterin molybdotransferase
MAESGTTGEPDSSGLLTVRQAIEIIDSVPIRPRAQRWPLSEAMGLRLAEDLVADRDYPPFDKSMMDGYAVRSADVTRAGVELHVTGEILAGQWPSKVVGIGEAIAIMTGAPMPAGADGVVPVEDVEHTPDGVRVLRADNPGRYIARRGSDTAAGQILLPRGTRLEAAQIAVAASIGAAKPLVYAPPRVAILGTGDEIIPIHQAPGPAQIRDSNTLMLAALLKRRGCEVRHIGTVADDLDETRAAIKEGLQADVLFVTGGMSMGTRDYVPRLLKELGVEIRISKLRIKPGKPFVFGLCTGDVCVARDHAGATSASPKADATSTDAGEARLAPTGTHPGPARKTQASPPDRYVFGLPGNPVSAFVCTVRLALRLLSRLAGGPIEERWLSGRLEVGLPANGPREYYQPVIRQVPPADRSAQNEIATIRPLAYKGSADLFTLAHANALLVRAENEPPVGKGTLVRVLDIS